MYSTQHKTAQSTGTATKNAPGKAPFFQPKLTINEPGDQYEQEADAMADKVMRMNNDNQSPTFFKPAVSPIQRKCAHCEEEANVQKKEAGSAGSPASTPSLVHDAINSGGQSLDSGTRTFMESRFGYDFGNVQVHNDSLAHQSATEINALAYTHGNHVVFGEGKFKPHTTDGKQLLAHELTHVIQQKNITGEVFRKTDCRDKSFKTGTYVSVANENDFAVVDGYTAPKKGTIYDILSDGKQKFFCYGDNKVYVTYNDTELVPDLEATYPIKIRNGGANWSQHELSLVGQALKMLSPAEVALLHGYRFIRRDGVRIVYGDQVAAGITTNDVVHNDYTIEFWKYCFDGSSDVEIKHNAGISPGVSCIIHEIGHALEFGRARPFNVAMYERNTFKRIYEKATPEKRKEMDARLKELEATFNKESALFDKTPKVESQFEKLTNGRRPLTTYSATNDSEAFAEAYAIFKVNPDWLKRKNEKLYQYFAKGGFL